ncbi:TonB-dependent receptor [Methylopila jiangsuensis]|uniref:TonB-dependent receptor n=1 Tax=Methylopila jiangsuensis TaxID=586230 RepID=A0A9W6JKM8_9HYPH|nr:TonB-dependent receptor [Methylopila jiangsuensis]MDR6285011.1 hemoglobin/transferrin/lactoferrin receptor protein [Methylopila jiangsuensis]GLK77600.1 TonB-dependent receptor [Methylopila jiangsuensis]
MNQTTRAALLACCVSTAVVAAPVLAEAQGASAGSSATYVLDIPSKPLLSALADFTRATGVQVVRQGAERLRVHSRAVTGRMSAEDALARMLEGSGYVPTFTDPRTAVLSAPGEAARSEPALDGAIALDEIAVTGEHGPAVSAAAPGAFTVTPADIARKNPRTLGDLFAGEPGVQVGSSIPLSQKVYVRGVEETNVAVTIDGAAQNNKVFHHNATTYVDPSLLKQARVDPGVAPADAGFGALAGAIAYETKDVADVLGHDADGHGGASKTTFNSNGAVFGQSVTAFGKRQGFEALGSFNWARGGDYRNGRGDRVRGTETDLVSGLAKLGYESGEGHRFELSHDHVYDDAIRPFRANAGRVTRPLPEGETPEPDVRDYRYQRQNTVLNYSRTAPDGLLDPRLVLAYSAAKVKVPTYVRVKGVGFVYDRDSAGLTSTLNGKAENAFALPLGSVTAGVSFRHDVATLRDRQDASNERMTNLGAYAQARLEPVERVRLSFGARLDHQRFEGVNDSRGADISHSGVSGNVSGEYDLIRDLLTAKAGYSHVWGGVTLAENFIMNPAWVYDGPGGRLRATVSDNVSAGLTLRRGGFTLDGSVFRTRIDNARNAKFALDYQSPYGGPTVPGAVWAPDVETRGFELGAGYAWESGFVRVRYAHIDLTLNGRPGDTDTGNYIATPVGGVFTVSAAHTFADWSVTIGGDVEITPRYRRTAVNPATFTDPEGPSRYRAYPAYQIVNAFIERKLTLPYETTLRLDVRNIFDETYARRASYGSEFPNVTPLYEPGRSFLATAQVKF